MGSGFAERVRQDLLVVLRDPKYRGEDTCFMTASSVFLIQASCPNLRGRHLVASRAHQITIRKAAAITLRSGQLLNLCNQRNHC